MRVTYQNILFILLIIMLASIILLTNGFTTINVFGRQTTPYVFSTILYLTCAAFLFKKWMKLKPLTLILIISYFGVGIGGLLSMLILDHYGLIVNSRTVFNNLIRDLLFGPVLLLFLIQHLKIYMLKEIYMRMWVIMTAIVISIALFQILAISGISPFEELFLWENIRDYGTRIASTFRWQGPFVLFLGISIPIIISFLITAKNISGSILYGLIYYGGIVGILYSGSRTAFFMLPLSSIPIIIGAANKAFKNLFVIIATTFMAIITLLYWHTVAPSGNLAHAPARSLKVSSITDNIRFRIVEKGLELWAESPLFGIGAQQLQERIGIAPHNSYLEILVERGIITAIPFMLFLACILFLCKELIQYKQEYSQWLLRVAVAIGFMNFFIYNFSASAINYNYMVPFLAMGLSYYEDLGKHSAILNSDP